MVAIRDINITPLRVTSKGNISGGLLRPDAPNPWYSPLNASIGPGTGWANDADRAGWYVPIKDCQYPNPWAGGGLPAPTGPFCGGAAPQPVKSSPPSLRRR
ncbi:uncharacterized protein PGTG_14736 [Puccinia graminis f. sp. tritici CRL 75-36-700-3]|uniref:Uncharacterized protein n=1 Tax=Puccinia graminis f. sp. tritici (strain CRL 75-36-700-3 / race SCCL) TaxID=418459 RepID=E3KWV3_PUCGT|nr:uncharacterized protein PGTG_14736 [Puccinia graminis f. sp. tritici CRL 75-36-700-3]EFP88770.1 hypothetical protein PGTG_14736 [Puccinia graminis f. sp. tritici CRL 75-36-700-3]